LIVIVVLEYLSQRQGREMKKPGATPQGNSGDHKSAEGAKFAAE